MSKPSLFFRFGEFIYRRRLSIIFLWVLIFLSTIPFLPYITTPFKSTGFVDVQSKSAMADKFLDKRLGFGKQPIIVAFTSTKIKTSDPLFLKKIKFALSDLDKFPIPHEIIYPSKLNSQFSKDKEDAFVVVMFKSKEEMSQDEIKKFKGLIKDPTSMDVSLGGEPIFIDDVNKQTKIDLYRADIIAAPVSVFIMILVFGSLIAATIPIILGGTCAIIILTSLFFLCFALILSIFTINISLLLGLCLSLDYSLFIMSRFKEELRKKLSIQTVIGKTLDSAGRAIFFSGLAVFISLSALLVFPINILFSIGIGGLVAVFWAVSISMILLPAVLSFVKTGVNRLPVTIFKNPNRDHFWKKLAQVVVKHPFLFFVPCLLFLLFLSKPFLNAKFGISDADILPAQSESRQFINNYKKNFNEFRLTPIVVIASSGGRKILSQRSLDDLYDLAKKIKSFSEVAEVNSIVSTDKKITKKQYYQLYAMPKKIRGKEVNQLLKTTTGSNFTTLHIVSKHHSNAPETKDLILKLQRMENYKDLSLKVTGAPVNNREVMTKIAKLFPYVLIWILALTYLILMMLLRSLILPLKAIFMNIISLSASYGVLVYVFQEGHFSEWLHFAPQGMLDTSLIIIIFCALFGFSMDYEVFLLTRMKECYDKTKDNKKSIIEGIDQSGRLITSAAIIVIVLCGSFMAAEVLMVKEFGLGIAIAIFVDAFLVRSLLVPSVMTLLGDWNWYLPKWLDKILP